MDAETLLRIEQLVLAANAANSLGTHTPAQLHNGSIINLEHLQEGRARFRGSFETTSLPELVSYLEANPGGVGFIDPEQCRAEVFLNIGTAANPGHCDWTASLTLKPTAPFKALLDVDGTRHTQRSLTEWIEDWMPNLSDDGSTAGAGLAAVVAAIRRLKISATKNVTHTDKDFGASRSALEDIEASSDGGLPQTLYFHCEPYSGFTERVLCLRLSVITGETPEFALRIVSRETHIEDIAFEFKVKLLAGAARFAELMVGHFKP